MITWTDAAKQALENYCSRTRATLRGSGADADEVVEDLRRHVEEEIRAAKLTVVTEEDLRRILARVGEPSIGESVREPINLPSSPDEGGKQESTKPGKTFLVFAFFFLHSFN